MIKHKDSDTTHTNTFTGNRFRRADGTRTAYSHFVRVAFYGLLTVLIGAMLAPMIQTILT